VGWCCMPDNSAWEDGLVHVAHVAAHCVGVCCHMLVVFTWASTCCAGAVVVHIAAMHEAVVPILETFYWRGGEAAWGLISDFAAAISTTIAAAAATTTADVATAVHIATATAAAAPAIVTATAGVAATTAAAATVAAAIVVTALLAMAMSTPWASWLLLQGLTGADCLAEHLKLPLHCQDVGNVQS
jgi:hypothetical protein